MNTPAHLPAAPWTTPNNPDSRAIVTGNGYFLLNLEGLDVPDEEATARALRQAVAALPAVLTALSNLVEEAKRSPWGHTCEVHRETIEEAFTTLAKAGAVPPTA
jgi:hypothetical protein